MVSIHNISLECQGECKKEGRCFGDVKPVIVYGNGWTLKNAFQFSYCQEAMEEDVRRGFDVDEVDEYGLTAHDYRTDITYPNG